MILQMYHLTKPQSQPTDPLADPGLPGPGALSVPLHSSKKYLCESSKTSLRNLWGQNKFQSLSYHIAVISVFNLKYPIREKKPQVQSEENTEDTEM